MIKFLSSAIIFFSMQTAKANEILGQWESKSNIAGVSLQTDAWNFLEDSAIFTTKVVDKFTGQDSLSDIGYYSVNFEGRAPLAENLFFLNMALTRRVTTPLTEKMTSALNSQKFCDKTDWKIGVPFEVAQTSCGWSGFWFTTAKIENNQIELASPFQGETCRSPDDRCSKFLGFTFTKLNP
jgi:hypothetical protein